VQVAQQGDIFKVTTMPRTANAVSRFCWDGCMKITKRMTISESK